MSDELSLHAAYPFFASAEDTYASLGLNRDAMKANPVRSRAVNRVETAITDEPEEAPDLGRDGASDADELIAYPLARILVSIIDSDPLTERYAEAEAKAAVARLERDTEPTSDPGYEVSLADAAEDVGIACEAVAWDDLFRASSILGDWDQLSVEERERRIAEVIELSGQNISIGNKVDADLETVLEEEPEGAPQLGYYIQKLELTPFYAVSPPDYLQHAPLHRGERWSLSQRSMFEGYVLVPEEDLFELLENAIHASVSDNLPTDVDADLVENFGAQVGELLLSLPTDVTNTIDVRAFSLLDEEALPREYALGWEDFEQYPALGTDDVDIPLSHIREHYAEAESVYEALGTIDELHTGWLPSHNGWYVYETLTDRDAHPQAWDEGFTQIQRPSLLPDDFEPEEAGRSVYTTNSYSSKEVYRKRPFKYEEGDRVWMDDELEDVDKIDPLPGYGELGAYSLLVDIDLEDEWKQRPLPEKYREVVETRLGAWVNLFASFVGGDPDDVFVVDSGGGAYVLTPPAITKPIADEFDTEAEIESEDEDEDDEPTTINEVEQINEEIRDRMRTLTSAADELITGLDDAPDELFSADSVQNKNRQWKTLLSVHASIDAVVHPLHPLEGDSADSEDETDEVPYEPLAFDEVSEAEYAVAEEWAEQFTSQEYADDEYLDAMVKTLFTSDVFEQIESYHTVFDADEGDGWREILETFLENRKERLDERADPYIPGDRGGSIGEVGVTTSRREVVAAINEVDLESYVRQHHAQQWDTDNRSDGTVSFSPKTWRKPSSDANSCFYGPPEGAGTKPIIFDRKESFSADVVDLVAYDAGLISHPSERPEGEDWWRAVDLLREQGEDIPIHLPDITDNSNNYEQLSSEHVVEAALALDIATEEHVETRDGEYGEYRTLTDAARYNATLDALEELGIEHGRERLQESE